MLITLYLSTNFDVHKWNREKNSMRMHNRIDNMRPNFDNYNWTALSIMDTLSGPTVDGKCEWSD